MRKLRCREMPAEWLQFGRTTVDKKPRMWGVGMWVFAVIVWGKEEEGHARGQGSCSRRKGGKDEKDASAGPLRNT